MSKLEPMSYDVEQNQWYVKQGNRSYSLHCGEPFELYIGETAFPCRLELDTRWYVILPETKFILHPRTVYYIKM